MAKYTTNFIAVIDYYQNHHSYKRTAKHFNLPTDSTVELWVKLYQTHGIDGIKRRNTKAVYDLILCYNGLNTQTQRQKKLCQIQTKQAN